MVAIKSVSGLPTFYNINLYALLLMEIQKCYVQTEPVT